MKKISCVIMDWAGTAIDFGCFAPLNAFLKVFSEEKGIDITYKQAREPMGLLKIDHIKAILTMPEVAEKFRVRYGRDWNMDDVNEMYQSFEKHLFASLRDFTTPIPGVIETMQQLREQGIKIGSTTGYTQAMMDVVRPEAAAKGYVVDNLVTPNDVPAGRPAPYMIYKNMIDLAIPSVDCVVKVGDTITHVADPCDKAISGFQEVKPMVFAGVYPIDPTEYENLRASLEKLQLNDASLTFSPESSVALGFGFRCGFLGLLHMDVVQERLDREFNMDVITTVPNVSYMVYDKQGGCKEVHNPSGLPEVTNIDHIEEPYIRASIITAAQFMGPIVKLCLDRRGELINQQYVSGNRMELTFMLPLGEIVIDFYDKLKSISKGYASFDYHIDSYRPSKLAKLDILLNGEPVDALSTLTHQDNAVTLGRRMCEKLKELIPRQQFDIAIQAAIGAKIVARETVKQVRKDVLAKCYGGDVSRKRKLLEKQKRGKKRMKQIGNVEVPQKAFLAVLKLD